MPATLPPPQTPNASSTIQAGARQRGPVPISARARRVKSAPDRRGTGCFDEGAESITSTKRCSRFGPALGAHLHAIAIDDFPDGPGDDAHGRVVLHVDSHARAHVLYRQATVLSLGRA